MIGKKVRIRNELGLHARAAAKLVKLASGFESTVTVSRADGSNQRDGKSILGLLALAASKGTEIFLSAEGRDEEQALKALTALVSNKFGEER